MTTRRELIAGAALLAPFALGLRGAHAVQQEQTENKPQGKPQFLFVQSAQGMTYTDGLLTLKGVSPVTVLFSDRPERIAGHMATESFVPFWSEGENSFESDPPNANLSVLEEGEVDNVILELSNPKLAGQDLSYEVKVLEGAPPPSAGSVSLFIDIIGMPLTPLSFAGARRRMWRRAVLY